MQIPENKIPAFQKKLEAWYGRHHRKLPWRESSDPYPIWISEVMLQQTQVKTVVPYFLKFLDRFPTIAHLAEADLGEVLKLWEGLGYYARARNFHKAAQRVTDELGGIIPDRFSEFQKLPGVGDYIGSAVLSIAFDCPLPVVDGNVKRVLARLFCINTPVNATTSHKAFKPAAQSLLNRNNPGTFNQAMMELGALICVPKTPKCEICPVAEFCNARLSGQETLFPVRNKSRKVPVHCVAVGIVCKKGKLLITQRKPEGLLGGLWEFPGGKLQTDSDEDAASACIREVREETGLRVTVISHLTTVRHAYTHFKIIMDVFYCRYDSGKVQLNSPVDFKWVSLKDLDRFAFPKANLKFIPLITEESISFI